MFGSLCPQGLQHTRLSVLHCFPELAQTYVHSVGDPIQPSHSLLPTSPPAFNLSQHQGLLFVSGAQSIGASASASIFPVNIQGWFPLGLTGSVSLQSKGLSRVFSSTTKASVLQPTKKAEHQRIDLSVASYTNQQQGICLIVKWQSMIVEGTKI